MSMTSSGLLSLWEISMVTATTTIPTSWSNARYGARYSCGQVGAINVLYGSADGVTTTDDHFRSELESCRWTFRSR